MLYDFDFTLTICLFVPSLSTSSVGLIVMQYTPFRYALHVQALPTKMSILLGAACDLRRIKVYKTCTIV